MLQFVIHTRENLTNKKTQSLECSSHFDSLLEVFLLFKVQFVYLSTISLVSCTTRGRFCIVMIRIFVMKYFLPNGFVFSYMLVSETIPFTPSEFTILLVTWANVEEMKQ